MGKELLAIGGFFSFWLGACVASFLNVVAWRLPRGESVVSPPSHSPKCNAAIRWWQNVPILSWLALRGRCAACREPISPRYIIVETIGGCLFLAAFVKVFGEAMVMAWSAESVFLGWLNWVQLFVQWVWLSLMLVGSVIDYDHKLLPDFVTVGGMVLGVAAGVAWTVVNFICYSEAEYSHADVVLRLYPLLLSLSGLAVGFGLLWLVRFFGSMAFKREAMGMGDVFLMGAVGALFGPVAVLVTLILSSVFGAVVGLSAVALSKTRLGRFTEIPYGPYICMGCLVWMFWGPQLVRAYLDMLR